MTFEFQEPGNLRKTKPITYEIKEDGCWDCVSHHKGKSGHINLSRNGRIRRMHEYIYEVAYNKEAPRKEKLKHTCPDPWCINPAHMYYGANPVNTEEKIDPVGLFEKVIWREESFELHVLFNEKKYDVYTDFQTFMFVENTVKHIKLPANEKEAVKKWVKENRAQLKSLEWETTQVKEWNRQHESYRYGKEQVGKKRIAKKNQEALPGTKIILREAL